MICLTVAMFLRMLFDLCLIVFPLVNSLAVSEPPRINYPQAGEVLQGVVAINGSIDPSGFRSAEISFGYEGDPTNTWFLITQINQVTKISSLASWDTTTITDGIYRLRIWVSLDDGSSQETIVNGLRVRNYTPVETNTPAPVRTILSTSTRTTVTAQTGEDTPVPAATSTVFQTPTPLPENPAKLTSIGLTFGWLQGMLFVFVFFGFMGVYFWIRSLIKHR